VLAPEGVRRLAGLGRHRGTEPQSVEGFWGTERVTVERVPTRCADTEFICAFAPLAINTTTEATTR